MKSRRLSTVLVCFCALTSASAIFCQTYSRSFTEPHVLRSVRQIHSAQATYQATSGNGNYGSLGDLRQAGLIDEALASGQKYGYAYTLSVKTSPARFSVMATPRSYRKSGVRSFYVDQVGDIRGADHAGGPATPADPVIDDCTDGSIVLNERCTIQDMRMLYAAQLTFAATTGAGNYGLFPQLFAAGLIRGDLSDYVARGYEYQVLTIAFEPGVNPASFKIWANPRMYGSSAVRSFFIDQTGVLRGADHRGEYANESDPPVSE